MPVDSFLSWEALGFSPQTEVTLIIQDCYTRNVMGCYALNADTYRMITGSGEVHILEDGKGIPFRYNGAGIRCTGFSVNTSKTAILMEAEFPVDDEQESDFGKIPVDKSVILGEVFDVIQERKTHPPEKSYVAKKLSEGIDRILKKIGEEAGEVIIAAKNADPEEIGWEMADLIFHMWLVLGFYDLTPNIIYDKLIDRRK